MLRQFFFPSLHSHNLSFSHLSKAWYSQYLAILSLQINKVVISTLEKLNKRSSLRSQCCKMRLFCGIFQQCDIAGNGSDCSLFINTRFSFCQETNWRAFFFTYYVLRKPVKLEVGQRQIPLCHLRRLKIISR